MNTTRMQFMSDLQRIEDEGYQLREGEQVQDFLTPMLQYIGDPQPELRDNLIYPVFYMWIKEQDRLNETELCSLLTVLLDEQHLFYHIGNEGDQTVFTRTFSALPIALIVRRHRLKPFLDDKLFQHLKESLLRYFREEKDLRGFLEEGGWAHSAAHGADAFDELVQCPEADAELQLEVLDAIQRMLYNEKHIFSDEEDERMASIVNTMIVKELLPQHELNDWIVKLAECMSWPRSRAQTTARVNSKNFLRSLYFRRNDHLENRLTSAILEAGSKLNRFAASNN